MSGGWYLGGMFLFFAAWEAILFYTEPLRAARRRARRKAER